MSTSAGVANPMRYKLNQAQKLRVADAIRAHMVIDKDPEGYLVWPVDTEAPNSHLNAVKLAKLCREHPSTKDTVPSFLSANHVKLVLKNGLEVGIRKPRPKVPEGDTTLLEQMHKLEDRVDTLQKSMRCFLLKLEWLATRCGYPIPSAVELEAAITRK